MTYGLPVIVSEGDGTQADMVRPENGWLIPANDKVALMAALEEALLDAARLREMGNNSFRIVQDEINIEQMVKIFIKVLNLTNYSVDHKS
jgi:glycosyltransferase involved in cell wall biosynthesis